MDNIYTVKQASLTLGISEATVRGYIRDGSLAASRFGTSYVITPEALRKFKEERARKYGKK